MTVFDAEYAELLRQYVAAPTDQARELAHARYLLAVAALGGTTGAGLPYPDPSDPVAGGADAIRALAEALDPATATTWNAPHITDDDTLGRAYFGTGSTATNQQGTYIGMSPTGGTDDDNKIAYWFQTPGLQVFAIAKTGHITSPVLPYAMAAGTFTLTVDLLSNDYVDTTVTFPTGRFTQTPRISATAVGPNSVRGNVSAMTITSTSTRIRVFNPTTGGAVTSGTRVDWTAVQMTEGSGNG